METTNTVKLSEIQMDPKLIELRTIDSIFVSRYRQAYRHGANMPLVTIDKKGNIISGNHRYKAMLEEFGKDHEITVNIHEFKTERDRLEFFTMENSKHGNPLDGISKKRIALALLDAGATDQEVASLFNVAVKNVTKWGDDCVIVSIGGGKTELKPMKNGPEIEPGTKITKKQYEGHKVDRGISPISLVNQLLRWIKNDWIAKNDKNICAINSLIKALEAWVKEDSKKVA